MTNLQKKIVVLGAGESGVGAAILAKTKGFHVLVSDSGEIKSKYKEILVQKGIPYEEKQHTINAILAADEIIKSPGIPEKTEIMQTIRKKGIKVISEIEFAGRYTNAKMICITGSNGKTTTTMLTYHILKNAGLNVGLGGNVGKSFAQLVAEENFDYYVLELSSFQLDDMYDFKADIAILTNITPDHLDRYHYNFQEYIDSKMRIINNQSVNDCFIYCMDDEATMREIEKRFKGKSSTETPHLYPFTLKNTVLEQGAYSDGENLIINHQNDNFIMKIQDLSIKGKHNVYNSMASGINAKLLDIRKQSIRQSLTDFEGVEHRLEVVKEVRSVTYINDSKATNVNSTWYALESMTSPVIWIVGGVDKGNDYAPLIPLVKQKVKSIICLGIDNSKLHNVFEGMAVMTDVKSMEEAIKVASSLAIQGDAVLLSPCCASFDLFQNYEDRGQQFKNQVNRIQ